MRTGKTTKPKTEPHIRHPVELLKSPAMWALSRTAHKILMYIECQGAKVAGKKNGKVPITYESLEAQGLHTNSIPPAINEIHALGLAELRRGRGGNAEFRRPNFIRLTYLPSGENNEIPATNEWKAINTLEEAEEIANRARAKKSKPALRKCGRPRPQKVRVKHPSFRPQKVRDTDQDFHPHKVRVLSNNAISHLGSAASEPVTVSQDEPKPEPTRPEPATAPVEPEPTEPEPGAVDGDDMNDNKQEQDLISMIEVLRQFLGNRATSGQWYKQMQSFGGPGWSKPAFKRRLKTLKQRKWIGIVGKPDAGLERAPEGSLFEAIEIAPRAPPQLGSDQAAAMSGTADAAATAAMELLERLNKGKTAA
jgi:hypothetical protein